ncbi:5271_t:CDS:1 [Scutellospora calospora]|uniref:5271_t:CDS:1 n=1 Tax=Scutellospora calospora TaxID=85575 RepID=A0ACA9KLC9_9GLOM|nr:5271_t:CDS:1 [Scutellospora calospora]
MFQSVLFIHEENPSAPNQKDNAKIRELQRRRARIVNKIEPLEVLPFPPKFDERIFLKTTGKPKTKTANGWFFYRKAYVEELKVIGRAYPMTEISKYISESWKNEPETVRKYYKELACKAANLQPETPITKTKPKVTKRVKSMKSSNESQKSTVPVKPVNDIPNKDFFKDYCIYSPQPVITPCTKLLESYPYDGISHESEYSSYFIEPNNLFGEGNNFYNIENDQIAYYEFMNTMNTQDINFDLSLYSEKEEQQTFY